MNELQEEQGRILHLGDVHQNPHLLLIAERHIRIEIPPKVTKGTKLEHDARKSGVPRAYSVHSHNKRGAGNRIRVTGFDDTPINMDTRTHLSLPMMFTSFMKRTIASWRFWWVPLSSESFFTTTAAPWYL